jgi:glucose-6-phosphate dehydrogenase assembly protein OpcA
MQDQLNIQTPRRVDPSSIDRELRKMWSEASADTAHPVIRARILNLVIFVDAAALGETRDAAAELAARHPSRTIIVGLNPKASESRLSAEVSARCTVSFHRRQQICSEQIVITADGRSVDDVHGLVAPLLTSDLHTFLWWRIAGWPLGHSLDVLVDHCDRILLDSARFVSGAIELDALFSLIKECGQRKPTALPIGDLNWTRLGVWRTALATLYDVPTYRDRLAELRRITISYVPNSGRPAASAAQTVPAAAMPIEPVLVAGWLGSRLGWKGPEKQSGTERGNDVFRFSSPPAVELVLEASGPAQPDAIRSEAEGSRGHSLGIKSIAEIRFECGGEPATSFSVRLKAECLETVVLIEGQTQANRIVACDDKPDADLVAEELDILGKDTVYEDAIHGASILARLL